MKATKKNLSLKNLTKSSAWDLQENDLIRMINAGEKDIETKENLQHYIDLAKTAFEFEEVKIDKPEVIKKYEARGMKILVLGKGTDSQHKLAVKKRPISRVTDLTYENIRHISAAKLLDVIDRNFGGGWDSLSQSIKDIIESGFEISTTTLPANRLHKAGSMYDKKVHDGFDVLEIAKGSWTEAIFAKAKPLAEMPKYKVESGLNNADDDEDVDNKNVLNDMDDDDDDLLDDDKLTEESYRTTFETDPDDLTLEDAEVSDEDAY